jgi:hypothetical protein
MRINDKEVKSLISKAQKKLPSPSSSVGERFCTVMVLNPVSYLPSGAVPNFSPPDFVQYVRIIFELRMFHRPKTNKDIYYWQFSSFQDSV